MAVQTDAEGLTGQHLVTSARNTGEYISERQRTGDWIGDPCLRE